MKSLPLIFTYFSILSISYVLAERNKLEGTRRIWAFLVASSSGFYNYRHQADLCHAYQLLHDNGIPDDNIIVMMADDIAFNPMNPTPGIIINTPGGRNVYDGVPKDYTGINVTPAHFLNVLSGNKTAMKGVGTGRVIESGPNDHIFVNFVDHGGAGVLCFGDEVLTADDLLHTLQRMASNSQFSKMIFYVEACHAGSLFDDILPDDLNVLVLTASDPHESSFACYFDSARETYLGDVFSISWINDSEHESLPAESLHHQFERVRTVTNTSHVEEYGDLDIGVTKLSEVIGFRSSEGANSSPPHGIQPGDTVSNFDVPLDVLNKRILATKDENKKQQLKLEKHHLLKKRALVDKTVERIVAIASTGNVLKRNDLIFSKYKLGMKNFPCFKILLKIFNERCFNVALNTYVRMHLSKLVNMCAVPWLNTEDAIRAITASCRHQQKGLSAIL